MTTKLIVPDRIWNRAQELRAENVKRWQCVAWEQLTEAEQLKWITLAMREEVK